MKTKNHAMNFAKFTRDKEVTQLKSMDKIWEQWYGEFLELEQLNEAWKCKWCNNECCPDYDKRLQH